MIRTGAAVVGSLSALVGAAGFLDRGMFGMHLSNVHNALILGIGIGGLIVSRMHTPIPARRYLQITGAVLLLAGFIGAFSGPGVTTLHYLAGMHDPHLWKVIPAHLEFGESDHNFHSVLGLVMIFLGSMSDEFNHQIDEQIHKIREHSHV